MNWRVLVTVMAITLSFAACDESSPGERFAQDGPSIEGLSFDGPQHAAYSPFATVGLKRVSADDRHSTRIPSVEPLFDERRIRARWQDSSVFVDVPLFHHGDEPLQGVLRVILRHLDGSELSRQVRIFRTSGWHTLHFELDGLPDDAEMADLAAYVLDYEVDLDASRQDIVGRRSLFEAVHKRESRC